MSGVQVEHWMLPKEGVVSCWVRQELGNRLRRLFEAWVSDSEPNLRVSWRLYASILSP